MKYYTYSSYVAPLGIISDIHLSTLTPKSALISWLPTTSENWNGIILYYSIDYELLGPVDQSNNASDYESDTGEQTLASYSITIPDNDHPLANNPDPNLVILPLKNESVTIKGLEEFHIYQLVIYYANSQGASNSSAAITFTTDIAGRYLNFIHIIIIHDSKQISAAPSAPPSNVTAIPLNSSSVKISWQPPPPLDRNGPIIGYFLELIPSDKDGKISHNLSTSDLVFIVGGEVL